MADRRFGGGLRCPHCGHPAHDDGEACPRSVQGHRIVLTQEMTDLEERGSLARYLRKYPRKQHP